MVSRHYAFLLRASGFYSPTWGQALARKDYLGSTSTGTVSVYQYSGLTAGGGRFSPVTALRINSASSDKLPETAGAPLAVAESNRGERFTSSLVEITL